MRTNLSGPPPQGEGNSRMTSFLTRRILVVALALGTLGAGADADHIVLTDGTRVEASSVSFKRQRKTYTVVDPETGAAKPFPAKRVADVRAKRPALFTQAIKLVKEKKFSEAIPILNQVVEKYAGLRWDVYAGKMLMEIHSAQGQAAEVIIVYDSVTRYSRPEWVAQEMTRWYLDALIKTGQTAKIKRRIADMLKSDHRPTLAMARLLNGDLLASEGKLKDALIDGYLRTIILYRGVANVQPEALSKAMKALENLGDSRADRMRQMLLDKYPDSEYARKIK